MGHINIYTITSLDLYGTREKTLYDQKVKREELAVRRGHADCNDAV